MPKARRRRATFVTTLVYADEPQLILLKAGDRKVVAMAIDREDKELPFIATTVSDSDWNKYIRGYVDLRFLFLYAKFGRAFEFDLADMSDDSEVLMEPFGSEQIPEDLLPSPRFFARHHTEPADESEVGLSKQSFGLDGEWDLPEFGQFYGKLSDIYAFNLALDKFNSPSASNDSRKSIVDAFSHYPWRGGFSYVHFYDDLYKTQAFGERLGVDSIQYASPGHVDILGLDEVFAKTTYTLKKFQENRPEIDAQYNKLHKYLSEMKLLKVEGDRFDNDSSIADYIFRESRKLAKLLEIENFGLIHRLAGRNALASSKIILSYYRRVEQSWLFFAEGRVQFRPAD